MRKLLLALLLALAYAVPAEAQAPQNGCNKIFTVNQAAVALTKIISGVARQSISICGISVSAGAAVGSASLSYGTGTDCATGTVVLIPAIALGINGNFTDHIAVPHIPVPAQNASAVPIDICLVTVGAGPTTVILYYAQF